MIFVVAGKITDENNEQSIRKNQTNLSLHGDSCFRMTSFAGFDLVRDWIRTNWPFPRLLNWGAWGLQPPNCQFLVRYIIFMLGFCFKKTLIAVQGTHFIFLPHMSKLDQSWMKMLFIITKYRYLSYHNF